MVRICQTSDTHEGTTTNKWIRRLAEGIAKEDFDILMHNGDYCGGSMGHKTLRSTVQILRDANPDKPFVSTLGNHDYWCLPSTAKKRFDYEGRRVFSNPCLSDYVDNLEKIRKVFKENNVHFLDEDGPFRYNDIVIIGHTGWYVYPDIAKKTNDLGKMPLGLEGDTHRTMQKKALEGVYSHVDALTEEDKKKTIVFASHFPVIKTERCDSSFEIFSWSKGLGDFLQEELGVRYFFNGHAHQLHKGPLRYESGSDYYKPRHHVVEVV